MRRVGDVRGRWNRRYAQRGVHPFATAPATWLVENRGLLLIVPGRRALDLACGDGRNAGYLARLGFVVDALDISDVAIDALRAAVAERQVAVRALRVNLETDPLPDEPYDVIVQVNYLQRTLFATLAAGLAPGGLLLIETVTRAHVENLGNQFDPSFLLDPGELRHAFPTIEVIRYREGVFEISGRPRAVASVGARRGRGAGLPRWIPGSPVKTAGSVGCP
jgi:tellurite methyltransferase